MLGAHESVASAVAFSPDGTRLFSRCRLENLTWNVESGKPIPNAPWEPSKSNPDQKWLGIKGSEVVLVDLEFKNTPDEKAFREQKARLDPYWHFDQGVNARFQNEWFAAAFHFAWALKAKPEDELYLNTFKQSFKKLEKEYAEKKVELSLYLPNIVKETLKKFSIE